MKPDFPHYLPSENCFGAPFVRYGKNTFRINTHYLAAQYMYDTQVRVYDSGLVRWEDGWKKLSESDVLNDLEDWAKQLCTDYDVPGRIQVSESELREALLIVRRKAYSGPMPQIEPDLIPVSNGVLRWVDARQDFEFVAYSPEIMVINRMPISYDPNAVAPQFEAVLQEIIPDPEDHRVAQEYLGAALFYANRTRKFLLCLGEGGCGKTILSLFLIRMLGTARVFELDIANGKKPYEHANLTDEKTLLTAPEAISKALCTDGAEWVKKSVGGDFFQTQQKFRNTRVDHLGHFSLIVMSNHQLRFQYEGRGDEWRDRVIPLFFDRHIPDERRNLNLVPELWDAEGPGIFNWFLAGARRVRRNKWKIELSPVQRDRIEWLLAASNPITMFVKNHVALSAGEYFTSSAAWKKYVEIRANAGLSVLEEAAFYRRLATAMGEVYQAAGVNSLPGKHRGYRGFELV